MPRVTLSQILKALGVGPMEFFREMKQFVERTRPALRAHGSELPWITPGLADDLAGGLNVREISSLFIASSVLAAKYRQQFARLFGAPSSSGSGGSQVRYYLRDRTLSVIVPSPFAVR